MGTGSDVDVPRSAKSRTARRTPENVQAVRQCRKMNVAFAFEIPPLRDDGGTGILKIAVFVVRRL